MIKISVKGVGVYRDILKVSSLPLELHKLPNLQVKDAIDQLDLQFNGKLREELCLEDGTFDDWSRILLNGKDIRFLTKEELYLKNGDQLIIMSVLAGG